MRARCLILTFIVVLLFAPALFAEAQTNLYVSEIEYKENGSVKIKFNDNTGHSLKLRWNNKEDINVYDRIGNKVNAQITWRGKESLELYVPFVRTHETYTFELRNINYGKDTSIVLTGYFSAVPGWKLEYTEPMRVRRQISAQNMHEFIFISDARYSANGFVKLTFGLREDEPAIKWDGTERVTVEGRYGRNYEVLVKEYSANSLTVGIEGLLPGESYFIEVRGIPYRKQRIALGTEFVVDEKWKYQLRSGSPK